MDARISCSTCGSTLAPQSVVCPFCGVALPHQGSASTSQTPTSGSPQPEGKRGEPQSVSPLAVVRRSLSWRLNLLLMATGGGLLLLGFFLFVHLLSQRFFDNASLALFSLLCQLPLLIIFGGLFFLIGLLKTRAMARRRLWASGSPPRSSASLRVGGMVGFTLAFAVSLVLATYVLAPFVNLGAGRLLYQANWEAGLNGWKGGASWQVQAGMVQYDGGQNTREAPVPKNFVSVLPLTDPSVLLAPYSPDGTTDYAIVMRIQARAASGRQCFGIVMGQGLQPPSYQGPIYLDTASVTVGETNCRAVDTISITRDCESNQLSPEAEFVPGTAWHLYRIEVRRSSIKVSIDGASTLIECFDPSLDNHMPVGKVALWSGNVPLRVSLFRIVSL